MGRGRLLTRAPVSIGRWRQVDIGRPKRIIEVEPASWPLPETLPVLEPEPVLVPQPSEPAP